VSDTSRSRPETNPHLGWGLLLMMLGLVELLPVPAGSWLIGCGLILIGLCLRETWRGMPSSWFTLGLGTLSLVGGIAEVRGHEAPLIPIVLVLIGARIVFGAHRRE
jgi:hypothetical protein